MFIETEDLKVQLITIHICSKYNVTTIVDNLLKEITFHGDDDDIELAYIEICDTLPEYFKYDEL